MQKVFQFPIIHNIDQFRAEIGHKPEIREMDIGNGLKCFCYMISGESTFDSPWALECRGITFNSLGEVASRPLHKFFNVGERESTREENIDWSSVSVVMDKRDGSMISTVDLGGGNWLLKSKKTFTSDVAQHATEFARAREKYQQMIEEALQMGITLIFEWTSPADRIVLKYEEPQLTLLHARSNKTGIYYQRSFVKEWAAHHGIPTVDTFGVEDPRDLLKKAQTTEGVEGWIIQYGKFAQDMAKIKTRWYLDLHHSIVFVRERDIAQLVLNESIDDLKSKFASEGIDLAPVLAIEARVLQTIDQLIDDTEALLVEAKKLADRKEVALTLRSHPLFGLMMRKYTGGEPNYIEYFERNHLRQDYSLDVISSGTDSEG